MLDYYDAMDELKIVGRRILEFDKVIIDRFAALGFDGIFTSDDLGHQTGPMMSPAVFRELYLPLYEEFKMCIRDRRNSTAISGNPSRTRSERGWLLTTRAQ